MVSSILFHPIFPNWQTKDRQKRPSQSLPTLCFVSLGSLLRTCQPGPDRLRKTQHKDLNLNHRSTSLPDTIRHSTDSELPSFYGPQGWLFSTGSVDRVRPSGRARLGAVSGPVVTAAKAPWDGQALWALGGVCGRARDVHGGLFRGRAVRDVPHADLRPG